MSRRNRSSSFPGGRVGGRVVSVSALDATLAVGSGWLMALLSPEAQPAETSPTVTIPSTNPRMAAPVKVGHRDRISRLCAESATYLVRRELGTGWYDGSAHALLP